MIKKSFLKSVFIYVAMQSLLVSTNVYANYLAVASWNFPSGYGEYQGYAETQADALNIARQMCANAQTITSWKGFCLNNPSRVDYLSTDTPKFCGEYATHGLQTAANAQIPVPQNVLVELN